MSTTNTNPGNASQAFIAWTGGSEPAPLEHVNQLERSLVHSLFNAQCDAFRAFWGKEPTADVREIYMRRARYDAHATMRAGCWSPE